MLTHIGDSEQSENRLSPGVRRVHWIDVGNLLDFKYWDPHKSQPEYLDLAVNDYIDYHLYTRHYDWDPVAERFEEHFATEQPRDAFSPLMYYLGVMPSDPQTPYDDNDLVTLADSLPKIIDYYRKDVSPPRGFFSTMYSLEDWAACTAPPGELIAPAMDVSKRLVNDCYHNYLWLTFASGSVGGPAAWKCAGGMYPLQPLSRNWYDVQGSDSFVHPEPYPEPLNAWTDEILDSHLALSRFTSLVRWKAVRAPEPPSSPSSPYRPMRVTKDESGGAKVILKASETGQPLEPSDGWLWTGASDRYITVGWIVHNFSHNYAVPEMDDIPTPVTPPWVEISGLASGTTLELVWFDDHKGKIIGGRTTTTNGHFNVQAPNTETYPSTGFGKSIAFLIQPIGFTPNKDFAALPSTSEMATVNTTDMIAQIVIEPLHHDTIWVDEHPTVDWDVDSGPPYNGNLIFTAWTKPRTDVWPAMGNFYFAWDFGDGATGGGQGANGVGHRYGSERSGKRVKVTLEVRDHNNQRISGDVMYVDIKATTDP